MMSHFVSFTYSSLADIFIYSINISFVPSTCPRYNGKLMNKHLVPALVEGRFWEETPEPGVTLLGSGEGRDI